MSFNQIGNHVAWSLEYYPNKSVEEKGISLTNHSCQQKQGLEKGTRGRLASHVNDIENCFQSPKLITQDLFPEMPVTPVNAFLAICFSKNYTTLK